MRGGGWVCQSASNFYGVEPSVLTFGQNKSDMLDKLKEELCIAFWGC